MNLTQRQSLVQLLFSSMFVVITSGRKWGDDLCKIWTSVLPFTVLYLLSSSTLSAFFIVSHLSLSDLGQHHGSSSYFGGVALIHAQLLSILQLVYHHLIPGTIFLTMYFIFLFNGFILVVKMYLS